MPITLDPGEIERHRLIRRVLCARGSMRFQLRVAPRFDYAREEHSLHLRRRADGDLRVPVAHARAVRDGAADATARTTSVGASSSSRASPQVFELDRLTGGAEPRPCSNEEAARLFAETVGVLAALAVAIALPRTVAGDREPLRARAEAAHLRADRRARRRPDHEPARAARRRAQLGLSLHLDPRRRILASTRCSGSASPRRPRPSSAGSRSASASAAATPAVRCRSCTAIDGARRAPEEELTHLEGYAGSAPVRIGNGAADQLQLDIYGEMLDSIYLSDKCAEPISAAPWDDVARVGRLGLRELGPGRRGDLGDARRAQGLHLLAADVWVGLDRAVRIGDHRGLPADRPALDGGARCDLPPDHGPRLVGKAPGLRPALRGRRPRRLRC